MGRGGRARDAHAAMCGAGASPGQLVTVSRVEVTSVCSYPPGGKNSVCIIYTFFYTIRKIVYKQYISIYILGGESSFLPVGYKMVMELPQLLHTLLNLYKKGEGGGVSSMVIIF